VEKLRRDEFTPSQCRMVAGAYAEMQRQLHICNSQAERRRVFDNLERKVMIILYGERTDTSSRETELASQTGNGNRPVRSKPVLSINTSGHSVAMHAHAAASNH
jgi:hypothetical protein